ncbi:MAG TPA: hypothetical protein VIH37_01830, partial [Candidatus Limnocylindrales bacterium]
MIDRRSRPAGIALLALVLVAGCSTAQPTPSAGVPMPSAVAAQTPSPSSPASPASSAAPSAAPSASASAGVSCTVTSPSASFSPHPIGPDDPNAALLSGIESQVQSIRGITATTQVPRYTLDQTGLCAYLRQTMAEKMPPEQLAATERLYKQLDMMPANQSLEDIVLNLTSSQVVGFYDENRKTMNVIDRPGLVGPAEQLIYAHEYDHALQDQAYGLKGVLDAAPDQSDRGFARLSLVEGDATLLMSLWAQRNLTSAQLMQVVNAADPASQAALDAAPPILRETLLWPYTQGLSLVLGAYQTSASFGGVERLWNNPPDTTEQLIHPDKLASREPAVPVAFPPDVAKRLGSGWKMAMEDTLGELQLNILMRTGNAAAGTDPAAGWGGDRVALLEGPNGGRAAVVDTA